MSEDSPTFFFDNNLAPQLAAGMKAFGENALHLTERFAKDAEDEVWLPKIGAQGLFLVTRDLRIRRRPAEKRAYQEHGVGVFVLGGKNQTRCQLIQQVVRCWDLMKVTAMKERRPFIFRVPPSGRKLERVPF